MDNDKLIKKLEGIEFNLGCSIGLLILIASMITFPGLAVLLANRILEVIQ